MGSRVLIGISSPPFVASPAGLPGGYAPGALLGVTGSNPDFGDFRTLSKRVRKWVPTRGERQRARQLLRSCSGVPREGLGSDWSDRERLHFFTKWAIARLIVRWKDSLRNARASTAMGSDDCVGWDDISRLFTATRCGPGVVCRLMSG